MTLLVIGVHHEELAFGEQVVAELEATNRLTGLDVLRIEEGISGRHPRSDQRFYYEIRHEAIYRQIREAARHFRLVIDLHQGADDRGLCADVISGHVQLLDCLRKRTAPMNANESDTVRIVQLVGPGERPVQGLTPARTVIPPELWNTPDVVFVGLEVYVPGSGAGSRRDWSFAASVIGHIVHCNWVDLVRLDEGRA